LSDSIIPFALPVVPELQRMVDIPRFASSFCRESSPPLRSGWRIQTEERPATDGKSTARSVDPVANNDLN